MITAVADSAAPSERVWAYVQDVTRWPQHLPTFTSVTAMGGVANPPVGSRFEVRQPGLRAAVYEVTEWEPLSFTWISSLPGVTTTATHTVAPTDGGSRLTLTLEWTGLLGPLVNLVLARKAQRMVELEASTFAHVAETDE